MIMYVDHKEINVHLVSSTSLENSEGYTIQLKFKTPKLSERELDCLKNFITTWLFID